MGLDAVAPAGYELVGHGTCLDSSRQEYEHWEADQTLNSTYFEGDISECNCRECVAICDRYPACVGYSFYCCPRGVRCIAGASVLFSRHERPAGQPPKNFGIVGYYGSPTSGPDFRGVGRVESAEGDIWSAPVGGRSCYRRAASV